MNKQHNLPRRVIFAAAILASRYTNPEVAAFNRTSQRGCQNRREHFWFAVGRALSCRGMTDYEIAVRSDIRAFQLKAA